MIARLLAPFRLPRAKPLAASRASRRRSARAAVWSGALAFAAATAGLAVALDTVKPEWRDPEFGHRLNQIREWKANTPDRPLVVAFGSSRTQMGLSPAAMGFADSPGSPLVYNLGYRASRPLGTHLHLARLLDAGVKPDAILVQLASPELMATGPAEKQYAVWAPRFSPADARRLAPYTDDPAPFRRAWARGRLNPWSAYRQAVLSDLLPDWQPPRVRAEFVWEQMDAFGFTPHPSAAVSDEDRARLYPHARRAARRAVNGFTPGDVPDRVLRDVVGRCRSEGIAVAFFRAPESPAYRSWYSAKSRAALEDYCRGLGTRLGVEVFPAPDHLEETDFADGDHLLRHGAEKYSRWLADTHLRPWLVRQGVAR
jgi:hypothetical protein